MDREELAAWLRLTLTPGVGNATARKLLTTFALPTAVFRQSAAALSQVASPAQVAALSIEPHELADLVDATLRWLQQGEDAQGTGPNRRIVTLGDPCYPSGLLAMEDPPLLLYFLGGPSPQSNATWFTQAFSTGIAIVGSRNPTPQGAINARQFGRSLAEAGLTVVSGMALGVDGAAHEGALESAGLTSGRVATIAIVGTGLDRVYPKSHLELARRIARHGLVISEYPIGTPPIASNFPKRNRLIAGMTHGTLVIEAALQSGSLITARLAVEQGKDVFAIPGSIHSAQSRGCHALIKQGAKLVESAQDILEEMGWSSAGDSPVVKPAQGDEVADTDPEDSLLQALGFEPVSLDALLARTGLNMASLQARLMELELSGQVARLPGGLFQRIASA